MRTPLIVLLLLTLLAGCAKQTPPAPFPISAPLVEHWKYYHSHQVESEKPRHQDDPNRDRLGAAINQLNDLKKQVWDLEEKVRNR